MNFIARLNILAVTLLLSLVTFSVALPTKTSALAGSDFKVGRITDDSVFFSSNTISAADIQNFLNAKLPSCDTNGDKIYKNTQTRSQYGASKGYPAPYICMRNYSQDIPSKNADKYCPISVPAGSKSAAQIIFDVSRACNVNAKVLIVLLQKEQSLVTDDWPWSIQYRSATGYGCPDTAPCDAEYYGFFNQVYNAAHQFQRYAIDASNFNYKAGQSNFVQFNPNSTCSGTNVNILTQSTAALYNYTPYQPNQAALDNLNGLGDNCSAYGNRNFWRLYHEWFGTTYSTPPTQCTSQVANIGCVWRLFNYSDDSNFLTINTQERNSVLNGSTYNYDEMPFYAFTSPQPGTIPVYRIRINAEHLYTSSESEKNSLTQSSQNNYEGIAYYAYPASSTTNASYPVYRLSGSLGHRFVNSIQERDNLVSQGYSFEGVAFNAPSAIVNASDPAVGRLNVYRLNSKTQGHLYTSDLRERDNLIMNGWSYEGVMMNVTNQTTAAPVYRLFNMTYHMFTVSASERDQLVSNGWAFEGVAWYTDDLTQQVFRFYSNGDHFFTTDLNESLSITNRGFAYEGVAFGKYQGVSVPVSRLYDGTNHFFTSDINEAISITNSGWKYEGIGWYSSSSTTVPVHRLISGGKHFFTASDVEKNQLVNSGWKYEGIGWYSS